MNRANKSKNAQSDSIPLKYEPVTVQPQPCSLDEQAIHIYAFIDAFIKPNARDRWLTRVWEPHQLQLQQQKRKSETTQKAHRIFTNFESDRTANFCAPLDHTASWPIPLSQRFSSRLGVFFRPGSKPSRLTAAEAATQAFEENAIWSQIPGREALLFLHDGPTWLCKRLEYSHQFP